MDGVISVEVHRQKNRNWAISTFWKINQHIGLGCCLLPGEGDEHLSPDRLAAERVGVVLDDLKLETAWASGAVAVNMLAE